MVPAAIWAIIELRHIEEGCRWVQEEAAAAPGGQVRTPAGITAPVGSEGSILVALEARPTARGRGECDRCWASKTAILTAPTR